MRTEVKVLPELFLQRLKFLVPSGKLDAIANTFAAPKPTTFRINTLKVPIEQVHEKLSHQGFRLEKVPWCPGAFILRSGTLRELQETDSYRQGGIYVQSLSSMLPPLVLDPQPGERVLDIAAAPGSKTTQMACLMKGQGTLVANDNNPIRFMKLKNNVRLQGIPNVQLTLQYGETFGRTYADQFDKVLADVPCSAEGRFDVREPKTYRYWKPAKIREMVHKQRKLLASAIHAARPGGRIVYSTCTFAPEENEGVMGWALERFGEKFDMEPIQLPFPNVMLALSGWEREKFHLESKKTIRVLPTDTMEGFYLAHLRRRGNPV